MRNAVMFGCMGLSTSFFIFACEADQDSAPSIAAAAEAGPTESGQGEFDGDPIPSPSDPDRKDAQAKRDAETDADIREAGCIGPLCDAEIVASLALGAPVPTRMVVDSTNVYFAYHMGHDVYRVSKNGGTPTLVGREGGYDDTAHLAQNEQNLYILVHGTNAYRVDELPKTGGDFRTIYQSGFASSIDSRNLVVDGTTIYLASSEGAGGPVTLRAIDAPSKSVSVLYPTSNVGRFLASAGADLYWNAGGTAYRAPSSGAGTPQSIGSLGSNLDFTADNGEVFYSTTQNLAIHRVSGGTDTLLHTSVPVQDQSAPIVDATYVYIGAEAYGGGTDAVYRVPRAGGALQVFADQQERPGGLAQDATYVYWATLSGDPNVGGYIVRKAK